MSNLCITFFGTRGSIPVCGPQVNEFGGNTTCIAFHRRKTGRISIMDAGTGIRNLGKYIKKQYPDQKELNITFSHFHWDHIQGFPFFDPAYNPEMTIDILVYGREMDHGKVKEIFAHQMMEDYFPVPLDNMGATFNFVSTHQHLIEQDGVRLHAIDQNHPGGSLGFRVDVDGACFAIMTDHEHGDSVDQKYVDFVKDVDVLIHDAQYTHEELQTHKGWGHSSYEQCIELAQRANVKQLIFTHHDPDHDDDFLRAAEKKYQKIFPNCMMAREGMDINI